MNLLHHEEPSGRKKSKTPDDGHPEQSYTSYSAKEGQIKNSSHLTTSEGGVWERRIMSTIYGNLANTLWEKNRKKTGDLMKVQTTFLIFFGSPKGRKGQSVKLMERKKCGGISRREGGEETKTIRGGLECHGHQAKLPAMREKTTVGKGCYTWGLRNPLRRKKGKTKGESSSMKLERKGTPLTGRADTDFRTKTE